MIWNQMTVGLSLIHHLLVSAYFLNSEPLYPRQYNGDGNSTCGNTYKTKILQVLLPFPSTITVDWYCHSTSLSEV